MNAASGIFPLSERPLDALAFSFHMNKLHVLHKEHSILPSEGPFVES
jgi:hypothetical protein